MVDLAAAADETRDFLADYLDTAGASEYVIGVSGGLDSALALQFAAEAVGPDRVTGYVLPGQPSAGRHMTDARQLCTDLDVEYHEASIQPMVDAATSALPDECSKETIGNTRARVRMVLLYQAANEHDGLVIGPDNRSEYLLGYFTKYGDGAADVAPLADLYKTEVFDLARHVDLPVTFVEKTPTAELWPGQTDEGELGASYETIDAVLRHTVDDDCTVAECASETGIDAALVESFVTMHEATQHKRERPPTPGLR